LFSVIGSDIKQTARRRAWEETWGTFTQATCFSV